MYQKSRGVVLHTIKYSESSVIAKIYTEGFGLLSFMVKGVRTAKSKTKASLLQPLTILDLEFLHHENKPLLYIKEMKRHYNYQSLPFHTLKSAIALFILEVLHKAIREHEANEDLFVFISEALTALDQCEQLNPDFHLLFLIQLSRYLGFGPHENYSDTRCFFEMNEGVFGTKNGMPHVMDKTESQRMYQLMQRSLFDQRGSLLQRSERKQMQQLLLKYYQLHLENFSLKSPEVLEALFE